MATDYDIYGSYFGHNFEAMAETWERSLERHCPSASVELEQMPYAPKVQYVRKTGPDNLAKLATWRERLHKATRPVLFLDVDMYCRRDLSPVWNRAFDVAYTWRPNENRPVIGGFIAARPTDAAKEFFDAWQCLASTLMMRPVEAWDRMLIRGGLNQACLAKLTQNPPEGCKVKSLSPYEWNLCDECWQDLDESTRLVHCKGDLREHVLGGTTGEYEQIVNEWRENLTPASEALNIGGSPAPADAAG